MQFLRDVTVEPHVHRIKTDPVEGTLRSRRDFFTAVRFCIDALYGVGVSHDSISHASTDLHLVS